MGWNNMKGKRADGYFTVEAALVMPVVLMCYAALILLLCFIYERCIWEQNACRLPVWKEYVEGFVSWDAKDVKDVEEEVCRYILGCLDKEEEEKYLLGQNILAEIRVRGDYVTITRGICYPQLGDISYENRVSTLVFEPVNYLREIRNINDFINNEREDDDQE